MSQGVEDILVRIDAQTESLRRELRRADQAVDRTSSTMRNRLRRIDRAMRNSIRVMARYGAAAAAAGAALAVHQTRAGMQFINAQADLAESLDATIDGLRGVQIAAEDVGLAKEQAGNQILQMNARLGEAARGTGQAREALERLGLSAQDLMNLDVDERMARIADRVQEMGMNSAQAQDALRQLGVRNREMARLMTQGGDAIRAARLEVDEFGLSVSAVDAAAIQRANQAMQRVSRTTEVLQNQLAIAAAPFLEHLANELNSLTKESQGFRDEITHAIEQSMRAFGHLANTIEGVRRTFEVLGRGAALVSLKMQHDLWSLSDTIVNGPIRQLNALLDLYNRVPGIDIAPLQGGWIGQNIRANMEMTARAIEEGRQDIHDILMRPMPSSAIEERIEEIRELAQRVPISEPPPGWDPGPDGAGSGAAAGGDHFLSSVLQQNLDAINRQRDAFQELAEAGRRVYENTRTPLEQLNTEMARLDELLDAGVISWDTYARAVFDAEERLGGMSEKTREEMSKMDEYSRQAARSMQQNLSQFLFDPWQEGLDGMLRGFGEMLQRMIADAVAADLMNKITGGGGGGNAAGLFQGVMGLFGASFAGGGYTGNSPRVGGVDGKGGFPAILHPRETVIDHTRASRQVDSAPAMPQVNQNIIVQGRPDSRTANQIAGESARKQRQVQARYGA
ncbi:MULTISPECIES: hypothetical protein [unclassified Thioalkalivibrio]|uniref:hypothetical protein n=1 Tax=unclassified Thioalkalivibrio TaxID=2621013 RepID=UPI00035F7FAA|nr:MULTISPECIES: hypothetical protein [unclassified Thioalkalivibrio]